MIVFFCLNWLHTGSQPSLSTSTVQPNRPATMEGPQVELSMYIITVRNVGQLCLLRSRILHINPKYSYIVSLDQTNQMFLTHDILLEEPRQHDLQAKVWMHTFSKFDVWYPK